MDTLFHFGNINSTSYISLIMGFSLGFIHAFDVDHLMAVSVLAQGKTKTSTYIHYSSRWALGHGSVLIFVGLLFLFFGFKLPAYIVAASENMIGILLIVFGLLLLSKLFFIKNARHQLFQKQADGDVKTDKAVKSTPFLVGIIHGIAGNAPVVALIPALAQESVMSAITYLFLFSAGLFFSMSLFSFILSHLQKSIRHSQTLLQISSASIGLLSVIIGCVWIRF